MNVLRVIGGFIAAVTAIIANAFLRWLDNIAGGI